MGILDELLKRYKENSPQSLDAYSFKSYNKISVDFDKDSIAAYQDFIAIRKVFLQHIQNRNFIRKKNRIKDSLKQESLMNIVKSNQYFMWEKGVEYSFSKKYGEKISILDNKMSGFPSPIYEALELNISNLNKIPLPVKAKSRAVYRYYFLDTIDIDNRKTYVLKFKTTKRKLKRDSRLDQGILYVDAENYALKKMEGKSEKNNEEYTVCEWKIVRDKWFLDYEYLKIKVGSQNFAMGAIKEGFKENKKEKMKKFGNYLYIQNKFFDFDTNKEQKTEDFHIYTMAVKKADGRVLSKYRTDSLTEREKETYPNMGDFVKNYNIDRKVELSINLMRGNLRYKMIDLSLLKFLDFDKYQGVRLGAGIKLNEKFNETFSPDVYFGYGFKDHRWKYGLGLDMKLSQKRTSVFRIDFSDDVFPAGRVSSGLWDNPMKLKDIFVDQYNVNFYRNQKLGISFLYDLSNGLSTKISVNHEKQNALFDYWYRDVDNNFKNVATSISIRYAPNDKNLMTSGGKITYEKHAPYIFINYERGNKIFNGDMNYDRWDVLAIHQFKTKVGKTNVKVYGGLFLGSAPIWKHFEITGQTGGWNGNWMSKINKSSGLGFVTMPAGTFYADKFLGFQISHSLPFLFRTIGKNYSYLELKYQSVVGGFKNSTDHHFDFQVPNHNYQEVGIIWNKFMGTKIGIGFFYRLGYYQMSAFKDNIGFQTELGIF